MNEETWHRLPGAQPAGTSGTSGREAPSLQGLKIPRLSVDMAAGVLGQSPVFITTEWGTIYCLAPHLKEHIKVI